MKLVKSLSTLAICTALIFTTLGCNEDTGVSSNDDTGSSLNDDNNTDNPTNPIGGDSQSNVSGTISGVVSVEMSQQQQRSSGDDVVGTLDILLDDSIYQFEIDNSQISGDSLTVPFTIDDVLIGNKNIVYTLNLTVNSSENSYCGYSSAVVNEGVTTTVDDDDFTEVLGETNVVSGSPEIVMSSESDDVTNSIYTISGRVLNCDLPVLIINVNGSNFISVDENESNNFSFTQSVALVPGKNIITVSVLNQSGEIFTTEPIIVNSSVETSDNTIMATLNWDTPETDIDIHCWYYQSDTPDFADLPYTHISYWNSNFEGVDPELTYYDEVYEYEDEYGDIQIETYEMESANLDLDDVDGFGPEHITFIDCPDGYYVFAANSFYLNGDYDDEDEYLSTGTKTKYSVTIAVGELQQSKSHTFTVSNEESYSLSTSAAWDRCFDVKVSNGVAEIITPDLAFTPVDGFFTDSIDYDDYDDYDDYEFDDGGAYYYYSSSVQRSSRSMKVRKRKRK
jgi:uncharacterized protein YfaP (DUF2135 family)